MGMQYQAVVYSLMHNNAVSIRVTYDNVRHPHEAFISRKQYNNLRRDLCRIPGCGCGDYRRALVVLNGKTVQECRLEVE